MVSGRGLGLSQTGGGGGEQKSASEGKEGGEETGWGFDPLEGISKYITFKGSKGRDLLKRRIFSFFIKPLKGFYKKDKKSSFKKRPREEGLRGQGKEGRGKRDWEGRVWGKRRANPSFKVSIQQVAHRIDQKHVLGPKPDP